jgi:hypothetical protein
MVFYSVAVEMGKASGTHQHNCLYRPQPVFEKVVEKKTGPLYLP